MSNVEDEQENHSDEPEEFSGLDALRAKVRESTQQLKAEQEAKTLAIEPENIKEESLDLTLSDESLEVATLDDEDGINDVGDTLISEEPISNVIPEQSPLPSESELDTMLEEIRELEREDLENGTQFEPQSNKDELKAILSSIPSFSQMNKK